jgi:hypothetical protein
MDEYTEIEDFPEGTVFQFGSGAPWLRTARGVRDLIPHLADRESEIPAHWEEFRKHNPITILYLPEQE